MPDLTAAPPRGQTQRLDAAGALTAAEQDVVDAARVYRAAVRRTSAFRVETSFEVAQALSALDAAVDALPDAGTDQTEDDHG